MLETVQIAIAEKKERYSVLAVIEMANEEYASMSDPTFWQGYEKSTKWTVTTDENVVRIVAKDDSQPAQMIGAVLYVPASETGFIKCEFPRIRLLSVPPQHRNKGIANLLIDFCEKRALSEGYKTIALHTTALMTVARKMYERRGYVRYPEIDTELNSGMMLEGYRKNFAD